MGYIKKTRTLLLIFILAVSLLTFGGSTIFYQKSLDRLTGQIMENNNRISAFEKTLESLYINHTKLSERYETKVKVEQELSEKYSDIKIDKESLEIVNYNISSELNITKKDLSHALTEILDLGDEVDDMSMQLAAFSIRVNNLTDQLDDVTNDVEDICEDISGSINLTKCEDYS